VNDVRLVDAFDLAKGMKKPLSVMLSGFVDA